MISRFEKTAVSGKFLANLAASGALKRMGYDTDILPEAVKSRLIKRMKDHMYEKDVVFWSSNRRYSPMRKRMVVRHTANKGNLSKWRREMENLPSRLDTENGKHSRLGSGVLRLSSSV